MKPAFAVGLLLAFPASGLAQIAGTPARSALGVIDWVCGASASFVGAPTECVKLGRSEPFRPDEYPMPKYPEEAKKARVEGDVSFHLVVGSGCAPDEITIDDGPKLLRQPVQDSVKNWKFCGVPEGQGIRATIDFRLDCPSK